MWHFQTNQRDLSKRLKLKQRQKNLLSDNHTNDITLTNNETWYGHKLGSHLQPARTFWIMSVFIVPHIFNNIHFISVTQLCNQYICLNGSNENTIKKSGIEHRSHINFNLCYSLGTPAFNAQHTRQTICIWSGNDRQLTIHREPHTGRPALWLSVETGIYGWAGWVWRRNETDNLKKTRCY